MPESLEVNIFPNPNYGHLNIDFGETELPDVHVKIYDLFGKLMIADNAPNSKYLESLNLSQLEQGKYLLQISSGEKQITKKIIIYR